MTTIYTASLQISHIPQYGPDFLNLFILSKHIDIFAEFVQTFNGFCC